MENILENLWYYYQEKYCFKQTKEEREILDILTSSEKYLYKNLSEEAKNRFKICKNCMLELLCIAECKAFEEGVRFMTNFLLEAFRDGKFYENKKQS